MTLAYGDVGSCRGPYALKIRTTTVSRPFREAISSQANSPTIFVVAYGDAGAGRIVSTFGLSSEFPYTAAVEANTTRRTPASTAALRTPRLPWTFVRQYAAGCATLSGTEVFAASWYTTSWPSMAAAKALRFRIEARFTRTSRGTVSRFRRDPVDRSSRTATSFRAPRRSTRCEPMKPAPPVTRTRVPSMRSRRTERDGHKGSGAARGPQTERWASSALTSKSRRATSGSRA